VNPASAVVVDAEDELVRSGPLEGAVVEAAYLPATVGLEPVGEPA